jgi:tetratricopeptide (TPR) repeat protein
VQPAVPQAPAIPNPSESLVDQLVREGVELRDRGDTTTALKRFDEALDGAPDNTAVLVEKAKTYDSIQLYDRSNELWRKIKEVSPPDSATYELADRRLKVGVSSSPPAEAGNTSPAVDAAPTKDVGGSPEGPIMGITEVKTTETPDPDAEKNLALQIGIKKQPSATIDHDKVKIFVKFYDTVGDKDIKLTDADVNKTADASSESSLSEAAASVRPGQKGRGKGSAANSGQRKYLGYIIQVYYDDDLQAVQAEPSRLLQHFPPSKNTSTQ